VIFLFLAYFVFLIVFSVYSYFALYQLREFGHVGDASRLASIIYISVASLIVAFTIIFFLGSLF